MGFFFSLNCLDSKSLFFQVSQSRGFTRCKPTILRTVCLDIVLISSRQYCISIRQGPRYFRPAYGFRSRFLLFPPCEDSWNIITNYKDKNQINWLSCLCNTHTSAYYESLCKSIQLSRLQRWANMIVQYCRCMIYYLQPWYVKVNDCVLSNCKLGLCFKQQPFPYFHFYNAYTFVNALILYI
jgi:hypothetical protein